MKNKKLLLNSVLLTLFLSYGTTDTYAGHYNTNTTSLHYSSIKHLSAAEFPKITFLNNTGSFFEDISAYQISLSDLTTNLHQYFNVGNEHTFVKFREYTDEQGMLHQSYQHYYKGIEVDGEVILIHSKGSIVKVVNGDFNTLNTLSAVSGMTIDQVKEIAEKKFSSENVKTDELKKVVLKIASEKGDEIVLKYAAKIKLSSLTPIKMMLYYIDLESGEIISEINQIPHANTPSTSATFYRGNQAITVDSYNGQYRLKDNTRNIHTRNGSTMNGQWSSSEGFVGASEFTSSAANFTATNTKPAVETHWAMSKTYDYYQNTHNRTSYDGNGAEIRNYYTLNSNYLPDSQTGFPNNAFALQGSYNVMVYGPGDNQIMKPVVGLDVAGHEFSHLVINFNGHGGLNYQGESGALNESFADMFGAAIEFYTNLQPNWQIGENIFLLSPYHMRDMSNPKNALNAFGNDLRQPTTYEGEFWMNPASGVDNGGVHINSGVGNYWFYLLSMGGSGTNDVSNAYNVQAQTIQKAEKIAYRALTQYLTPNAKFIDARNATIQAAKDLYGAGSPEVTAVENAWYAVNVGPQSASVSEEEMKQGIAVYPNPAEDTFVNIDISLNERTTAALYDIVGKQVRSEISLQQGNNKFDIGGMQAGVYILKFTVNTKVYSQKLVIK